MDQGVLFACAMLAIASFPFGLVALEHPSKKVRFLAGAAVLMFCLPALVRLWIFAVMT